MRYHACITRSIIIIYFVCQAFVGLAQFKPEKVNWTADGTGLYEIQDNMLLRINPLSAQQVTVLATAAQLTPQGNDKPLKIADFEISTDDNILLIFTNTAKVWRYNTRGDYWLLNRGTGQLKQIGKDKPAQSLMYAKLSPDGKKVGYVSDRNIYAEDIASGETIALTTDGNRQLINGSFDWV